MRRQCARPAPRARRPRESAQLGVGPTTTDPSLSPDAFAWSDAAYNADHAEDDNDEYSATLTPDAEGLFGYAFRFSANGGETVYGFAYEDHDVPVAGYAGGHIRYGEVAIVTPPVGPTADAGVDVLVGDTDNSGSESVTLDGSASTAGDAPSNHS